MNPEYIIEKLHKRWIRAIMNGLSEEEIRKYKIEYIKALEKKENKK